MEVRCFQCNPLQENCYVVSDAGQAVVIDPGAFYPSEKQALSEYISKQKLQLRYVLCTHGHLDHIFGAERLYQDFGIMPSLHEADAELYRHLNEQAHQMLGVSMHEPVAPLSEHFTDGQIICFGQTRLKVMHVPGHSPGCVIFYSEDEQTLFSGDTLFRMSIGRTDLEGGSWQQMMQSLRKIAQLPADTKVWCGHGPSTIMADELAYNPYFRND